MQPTWDETIVLDADHLAAFTGGDEELRQSVLSVFRDNAPTYLTDLAETDPGNWKQVAHKLKGAARSIGAWQLACAAERAERMAAPAIDTPERKRIILELAKCLEVLMKAT